MTDQLPDSTTTDAGTAPSTDQRSPDQDAAIEQAFINGTLPEADRRADSAPDAPAAPAPAPEESNANASVPEVEAAAEGPSGLAAEPVPEASVAAATIPTVPIPVHHVSLIHELLQEIEMREGALVARIRALLPGGRA